MAVLSATGSGDGESAATWIRFAAAALAASAEPDVLTALRLDTFKALLASERIADALTAATRARTGLPPGVWHANACLALGALSYAAGDDETATSALREGLAEATICEALTLQAMCQAHLALIADWADRCDEARTRARSARDLVHERGLGGVPTLFIVSALAALDHAREGNRAEARASWMLTRRNMELYASVAAWAHVQARLALARTSLLLDDPAGARILIDEAEAELASQPEAARARAQVDSVRALIPSEPHPRVTLVQPLSDAELRVLPYLATHLTVPEIATQLFISRHTVKSHVASIYRKLGASSRNDAVDVARSSGLLGGA